MASTPQSNFRNSTDVAFEDLTYEVNVPNQKGEPRLLFTNLSRSNQCLVIDISLFIRDTQKQLFAFELQIMELIQIRGFNIFWTIDLPLWMVC